MLRALVIRPNQRTRELGDLLQIARAEAQRREHSRQNVNVRALVFVPECNVYVAIYERSERNG
jgi:hypothetical protein